MQPSDTKNPNYFHKVVDCQWACPAHTDVPEYIRLIARGKFTESYLLNRKSNVFPGILGRVCDRPCEPACRRGRLDEKPVAICRLKRVAADHRDDVTEFLPKAPESKNGRRIACIGAGPASLTVANDLMPLGYSVTIFEKLAEPGGLMRTNIPAFRLPIEVLDDEIGMIVDMGVDLKLNTPVESLRKLLDQAEYDAVFVGSGAPMGRELEVPGRTEAEQIHIGIEWLEGVAFGHVNSIGKRVVIIGAGNTAMDCCRTAKRIGGTDVKVVARKPKELFKASEWELEEAEEEMIDIITNHAPERFEVEDGKLTGVLFNEVEWHDDGTGRLRSEKVGERLIECDAVILAVGQENSFPFIERDIGIDFDKWGMPVVDKQTFQSTREGVFFGGDSAFGPLNIIWAVAHGHEAAVSIHNLCSGKPLTDRLAPGMNLVSQRMGMQEWSYSDDWDPNARRRVPHVPLGERFVKLNLEVELGFTTDEAAQEVERCLNCDEQTDFAADLCIECDACIDVCPVDCLAITPNASEAALRERLDPPAQNPDQALFVSAALPHTGRVMIKDEDVCIHCGLCAERCPTAAWDMKKSIVEMYYAGSKSGE